MKFFARIHVKHLGLLALIAALPAQGSLFANDSNEKTADTAPSTGISKKILVFERGSPLAEPKVRTGSKQPNAISSAPLLLGETVKDSNGKDLLNEKTMILDEAKRPAKKTSKKAGRATSTTKKKNTRQKAKEADPDDAVADPENIETK